MSLASGAQCPPGAAGDLLSLLFSSGDLLCLVFCSQKAGSIPTFSTARWSCSAVCSGIRHSAAWVVRPLVSNPVGFSASEVIGLWLFVHCCACVYIRVHACIAQHTTCKWLVVSAKKHGKGVPLHSTCGGCEAPTVCWQQGGFLVDRQLGIEVCLPACQVAHTWLACPDM